MKALCFLILQATLLISGAKGQASDLPGQLYEEGGVTYYKSGDEVTWDTARKYCKLIFGEESRLLTLETEEKLARLRELISRGQETGEMRYWTDGARGGNTWKWDQGNGEEFGDFFQLKPINDLPVPKPESRALILIKYEYDTALPLYTHAEKSETARYICDTPKPLSCSPSVQP